MLRLKSAVAVALVLATPVFADPARMISVHGSGAVDLAPDMAMISIGISAEAETAGEAMAKMSTDSRAALQELLTVEQLESADVQTGQLTLTPRYGEREYGTYGPIGGFQAATSIDVRVRDLTRLGSLLDAMVVEGANGLNSLSFDVADRSAPLEEARRAAVADARARAELYANAAGVALGEVVSISEASGFSEPGPRMMTAESARSGVPIAPGEITVEAQVEMQFELSAMEPVTE